MFSWQIAEMLKLNLVFALIALQIPSTHLSPCPSDVVKGVFSCLANVTGYGSQPTIAGGDVHILRDNCRNGGFARVSACVETLFANCHSEKDLEVLNKLADTVAIRSSFSEICLKLDVYANSSECMIAQNALIQGCIEGEYARFHANLNRIQDFEQITFEYCKYSIQTSKCIERPVRQSCNQRVADLLARFMQGLTPPMCSPATALATERSTVLVYGSLLVAFLTVRQDGSR